MKKANKYKPYIAMVLTSATYYFSLYVFSRSGIAKFILTKLPFLSRSNIIQFSFLVSAIVYSLLCFKGNLSHIGFRKVDLRLLVKSMKTAIWVSILETIFFFAWVILLAPKNSGKHPASGGGFHNTVINVWIIASFCEEVLYRGFLQSSLNSWKKYAIRLGKSKLSLPVIIAALFFAVGHFCLVPAMGLMKTVPIVAGCFTTGLVAGYYREQSKSIIPAYTSHLISNIVGSSPMWISIIIKSI